ncbi:hypothetical protein [Spirillospora sp. CA-294931]|uniref:hypothetical protein n=1 Tax=Spirillospora sp. CA-294931 TaxID=3240042 RepID=UPI003D912FA4
MELSSAAHELYGVVPQDFMETRKRLVDEARSAGDKGLAKDIGALRKPTVSAWAVNLLTRSAGEDLERLLDAGADLREAWATGGHIGGLEQRRGELVTLLVRTARALAAEAGQPLRDPAVREVEETLLAATVDADVAEEVRVGRLPQPRSHAGFVPAGGFGSPSPARPPKSAPKRDDLAGKREAAARKRGEAAQAAREARARVKEAEKELSGRESRLASVQRELDAARQEAAGLRRELDKADKREAAVERRHTVAERRRDEAARALEKARSEAEAAARAARSG